MKKQFKTLPILLTIVLGIFHFAGKTMISSANATYVEGPITRDTIWTLVDSPFIVANDVVVYPGVTLTIEPGVEVRFGGAFSLNIMGKLYANGTSRVITFTSNRKEPEIKDWKAIVFNGTEKSVLIGCSVTYAENGITVENGDVEIENSVIGYSQNGILARYSRLSVKNSTVKNCFQDGINATACDLTIENCVVTENGGNGVSIAREGHATIQGNTVMDNGNGILLTGDTTSNVSVRENKITANKGNGIHINAINHHNISILYNNISSNGKGIYISTSTSITITNNSVSYNAIGFFYEQGSHAAHFNDIYGNEIGMDASLIATVNAEQNYWGDESGPNHEFLNPEGKGNPIGGDGVNIDFIFFLTMPISHINAPPTAILQSDKILVRLDGEIMFFATNSFDDDGQINWYFFDFGDGSNSGWTTLSVFTHKYALNGAYDVTLRVVDDFGALSSATIQVEVQNFPSLQVSLNISSNSVHEGEQVSIVVYVTDGIAAVENASVTMFSVVSGNFTEATGVTDSSGYFASTFTAPDITAKINVRIVARASKAGYADGSDYDYLEVSPFLSVQIIAHPSIIKSEENAQVFIYVRSDGAPVANASVTIHSTSGSVSPNAGFTNSYGVLSASFKAPLTTTFLDVTITAVATKSNYMNGEGQTHVSIEPKILVVEISADASVTISEAKLNVTVHVEYDATPIGEADITITADSGNFTTSTGLTDGDGNVTFAFTAPPVNTQSNITITATAKKAGYANGQHQLIITVNPRTFDIRISAPAIESGTSAAVVVSVYCKEDATPVGGAVVTIYSSSGNFSITNQTTNPTGFCTFIFTAPQTQSQIYVTVTANVTKNGYVDGGNQTLLRVTPKTSAQEEGGWPIVTILLILIPIIIVVIVVILIKLKIIVISTKEEE